MSHCIAMLSKQLPGFSAMCVLNVAVLSKTRKERKGGGELGEATAGVSNTGPAVAATVLWGSTVDATAGDSVAEPAVAAIGLRGPIGEETAGDSVTGPAAGATGLWGSTVDATAGDSVAEPAAAALWLRGPIGEETAGDSVTGPAAGANRGSKVVDIFFSFMRDNFGFGESGWQLVSDIFKEMKVLRP
jgi:hypothetical protein